MHASRSRAIDTLVIKANGWIAGRLCETAARHRKRGLLPKGLPLEENSLGCALSRESGKLRVQLSREKMRARQCRSTSLDLAQRAKRRGSLRSDFLLLLHLLVRTNRSDRPHRKLNCVRTWMTSYAPSDCEFWGEGRKGFGVESSRSHRELEFRRVSRETHF